MYQQWKDCAERAYAKCASNEDTQKAADCTTGVALAMDAERAEILSRPKVVAEIDNIKRNEPDVYLDIFGLMNAAPGSDEYCLQSQPSAECHFENSKAAWLAAKSFQETLKSNGNGQEK